MIVQTYRVGARVAHVSDIHNVATVADVWLMVDGDSIGDAWVAVDDGRADQWCYWELADEQPAFEQSPSYTRHYFPPGMTREDWEQAGRPRKIPPTCPEFWAALEGRPPPVAKEERDVPASRDQVP